MKITFEYRSAVGDICKVTLINARKIKLKDNKFVWRGQQKIKGKLVNRSIHSDDLVVLLPAK